jgi:hypothetical protein
MAVLHPFERPRLQGFVRDVQAGQFAPGGGEGGEIRREGTRGSSRLRLSANFSRYAGWCRTA